MPWIFNYGELGPQQLVSVLGKAPFATLPATLPKYKVSFKGKSRKWGGATATVEKARKSLVYGTALLVTPEDIKILDRYYKGSEKVTLPIFIDATQDKVKAETYILGASNYGVPSQDYTKAMLKHLKFFWGQGQKGLSLADFGISTELPEEKPAKRAKPQDEPTVAKPRRRRKKSPQQQ